MEIFLKEIPYTGEEESLNFCDVGADKCYEIVVDNVYTIGHLYFSDEYYTADGGKYKNYINWIEFLSTYRNKHLLRKVMEALYSQFGDIYFESAHGLERKYEHIGAIEVKKDEITELSIYMYKK